MIRDGESRPVCIPQIVSSPIGYEPMEKFIKDGTTEEGDYEIVLASTPQPSSAPSSNCGSRTISITARNIFYRADRNYCIITPGSSNEVPALEFHFEKLKDPIYCAASFFRPIGESDGGPDDLHVETNHVTGEPQP
jgi:hypothetical protein